MWFVCSNNVRNDFFTAKRMGNIPLQTILEQPLEHKMEVHEDHKYLYASCVFVSTCSVKCHFIFFSH